MGSAVLQEYDSELAIYVTVVPVEIAKKALAANGHITLISAVAQAWMVFINGQLVGTGSELSHDDGQATIVCPINTSAVELGSSGDMTLALVSTSLGIGKL